MSDVLINFIDRHTFQALNIKPIYDRIEPLCELGKKVKNDFIPYTPGKEELLRHEFALLQLLIDRLSSGKAFMLTLCSYLGRIKNIGNLVDSIGVTARTLEVDELFDIKHFVFYSERIRFLLEYNGLHTLVNLPLMAELFTALDPDKLDSPVFTISPRHSEKLSLLKERMLQLQYLIKGKEQERLRFAEKELGIDHAERHVVISRNNNKFIDKISASNLYYLSGENFANLTFSLRQSEELTDLESKEQQLRADIAAAESIVREQLTKVITKNKEALTKALAEIGRLDFMYAKAVFAIDNQCVIPTVTDGEEVLSVDKAVNLKVKGDLMIEHIDFSPIDINFVSGINIITGANMAGKSTILETIGQIFFLTSYAVPVPCTKAAVSLVDFIFTNRIIGDDHQASSSSGLSSFATEIVQFNEALKRRKGRGLFLIDEFAKGTNPHEGEAFAGAILEYFADNKNRQTADMVVAVTHFSSPALYRQADHYTVKGISEENFEKIRKSLDSKHYKGEDELSERIYELHKYMDYRLQRVYAEDRPPQAAIMIAEILGIDDEFIKRVKALSKRRTK